MNTPQTLADLDTKMKVSLAFTAVFVLGMLGWLYYDAVIVIAEIFSTHSLSEALQQGTFWHKLGEGILTPVAVLPLAFQFALWPADLRQRVLPLITGALILSAALSTIAVILFIRADVFAFVFWWSLIQIPVALLLPLLFHRMHQKANA